MNTVSKTKGDDVEKVTVTDDEESFYCPNCKNLMLEVEYMEAWGQIVYDHPKKNVREYKCCHCKQEIEIILEIKTREE